MTEAIRVIKNEHINIWRILNTLEEVLDEMARGDAPPDRRVLDEIIDYLGDYADEVHHPKEDEQLFRVLRERAPEEAGVAVDEIARQHEEGERLLQDLRSAVDRAMADYPRGVEALRDAAEAYIRFQRDHINQEEAELLPMARRVLEDEDWVAVNAAFAGNDDPLAGGGSEQRFRALQSRIAQLAPAPLGLGFAGDLPQRAAVVYHQTSGLDRVSEPVLEVEGLTTHYGYVRALDGIDLQVGKGHLVALVGANGAGKSTLLRTVSGLQPATTGSVLFEGEDITRLPPARRVAMGISQVPEGRQVFGPMTVEDNLLLGAFTRRQGRAVRHDLERMYEKFPILREKRHLLAATLSGGQQQMLVIARALMARPRLLLLDEPSMGLAPLLVSEIFSTIAELKEDGMTVFLVEQNASAALGIADHAYVLETGRIVISGPGQALLEDENVKKAYLGI